MQTADLPAGGEFMICMRKAAMATTNDNEDTAIGSKVSLLPMALSVQRAAEGIDQSESTPRIDRTNK